MILKDIDLQKEYDIDPEKGYTLDAEHGFFVSWRYDMFSFDKGNRNVDVAHVNQIVKAMKSKYLSCPIKVTKEFVILDGQHRFEACKILGKPLRFIFSRNETIDDMVIQNQISSKWKDVDYIYKYHKLGDKNYTKLVCLFERYSAGKSQNHGRGSSKRYTVGVQAMLAAASGSKTPVTGNSNTIRKMFLEGKFRFSRNFEDVANEVDYVLEWRKQDLISMSDRRKLDVLLLFFYRCDKIDEQELIRKFTKYREAGNFLKIRDKKTFVFDLLEGLQTAYNSNKRQNKLDFNSLYNEYLEKWKPDYSN